jgi:hypothetical protein
MDKSPLTAPVTAPFAPALLVAVCMLFFFACASAVTTDTPAPYIHSGTDDPEDYFNHDLADYRGSDGPKYHYIVIHSTEASFKETIDMAILPDRAASWHYTIRSKDGKVARHLDTDFAVGWHSANAYFNTGAIGIEHEGVAGNPKYFTEAMYQSSAALVKSLCEKYGIPIDRAHIIGHDEVHRTGTSMERILNQHHDPGPFWDWEHYFDLLGAPIGGGAVPTTNISPGDIIMLRTGYKDNLNPITHAPQRFFNSRPKIKDYRDAPTNFVYVYRAPDPDAPFSFDPLYSGKTNSEGSPLVSTDVSSTANRINTGSILCVAAVEGAWVGVYWAGTVAWFRNAAAHPVAIKTSAFTVTANFEAAPTYVRPFPEAESFEGTDVPPLVGETSAYTIPAGQRYAVTNVAPEIVYYHPGTFVGAAPGDRANIHGTARFYQVQVAHRILFVNAEDVELASPY